MDTVPVDSKSLASARFFMSSPWLVAVLLGLTGCGIKSTDDGGSGLPPALDGGLSNPIKYIVVIVKENHTFDNYFAGFPGADSRMTASLYNGMEISRPIAPKTTLPRDLCHSHACAATAYAAGNMNGFDRVTNATAPPGGPTDNLTFIRYTEEQIPNYWQYARHFTLADHFFSSTLGPSFPGHFAVTAGFNLALANPTCACGGTCTVPAYDPNTGKITDQVPCWDAPSVVLNLPVTTTWAEYGWNTLLNIKKVRELPDYAPHFRPATRVLTDLQSSDQPNLMFVHLSSGTSEHPTQAVCPGENQTVELINAVMSGPRWKNTAILLLWDDYGGFYDSVSPEAPLLGGNYFTQGFRVPLMVISPYARPAFVFKTKTEQFSIVKLIEDLWALPRMNPLDARIHDTSAGSLLGAFDFTQAPLEPLVLQTRTCP